MHPRHYRLRFLLDIVRIVVAPQVFLAIILHILRIRPGTGLGSLLSLLSVPALGVLRTLYTKRRNRVAASEHI